MVEWVDGWVDEWQGGCMDGTWHIRKIQLCSKGLKSLPRANFVQF